MSLLEIRKLEAHRRRRHFRTRRRDRRGVLLMVVLSILALFLMLGTAFLISSRHAATSGKEAAKLNRTTNNPSDLLERAMLQVVRDTNNPNSAIRYHSLLRDVYGSDGFIGQVYPVLGDNWDPQYSGAQALGNVYGPSEGQLIDIFVADLVPPNNEIPSARHSIKLERDPSGVPVDHALPAATDYYSGCLLTILTGPAAGQTTRIVDYSLVGTTPQADPVTGSPAPVFRLRVMTFGNAAGDPLATNGAFVLTDLVGQAFMVNGRAHDGTGAGYDRLAATGSARLGAVEAVLDNSGTPLDYQQLALMPNYQYFPSGLAQFDRSSGNSLIGHLDPTAGFTPFGNVATGQLLYTTAEGPGGSDESYDAVDYQNMFLAHMPLSPRAMASAINNSGATAELGLGNVFDIFTGQLSPAARFDHENTIIPSFHRPALANYWHHRIFGSSWLTSAESDPDLRARALADPYNLNGIGSGGSPGTAVYDQIVAYKRRFMLRPIPEDHPSFNGTNPASRQPFWEITGPWDVDNDNDGIADSVWVDLDDPVQKTENGTLIKPLYAFLVVDLDNRLNVNVHGSADHFANTNFDPLFGVAGNLVGNASSNALPVGMGWGPGDVTLRSIFSPFTQPYSGSYTINRGNPDSDDYARLLTGRLTNDPLSDAIWGRMGSFTLNGLVGPGQTFDIADSNTREQAVSFEFHQYPEVIQSRAQAAYDQAVRIGDAALAAQWYPLQRSAFATEPDLRGRWATGVDYLGQPVYEVNYDATTTFNGVPVTPLVDDSPYETYTPSVGRRGTPDAGEVQRLLSSGIPVNDDALFAPAEMERILRLYDPETGTAPSRLFEIVDAFDHNKYVLTIASTPATPTPEEQALAQAITSINSRQVTTDSYEVPVPADVVPSYITELGPDGVPGNRGDDDNSDSDGDGNNAEDVVPFNPNNGQGEIGWFAVQNVTDPYLSGWSDDFASLTGKSVADARLVDVLWYRIQRNRIEKGLQPYNWNNPAAVAILDNISQQLLPPEVLAGYKMDINRPFGDGQDNNGNGIVDEPVEAGEPFDPATNKFVDLNGNGVYDPPLDNLWAAQLGTPVPVDSVMSIDVAPVPYRDDGNDPGVFDAGDNPLKPITVRDDAHLARQLYARHLYVLTLLLADENYLAPYDPYDPSVRGYLRVKANELIAQGVPDAQAKLEARRRYTCRQMAQWAANCVDFRDADACNTPFEYDENPWDGWGVVDEASATYYPLDGDPCTDENYKQFIDWNAMGANGAKAYSGSPLESNRLEERLATRNVVWGAERPELLISETAAFHDVRLEDRATAERQGDNTTQDDDRPNRPQDDDPDQRLEPRGSLYVELYNPWSGDAPKPVELYRHGHDRDGDGTIEEEDIFHWADLNGNNTFDPNEKFEGVLLNRLSNASDSNGKRSPVWRLIVVEEHPGYHSFTGQDVNQVTRDNRQSVSNVNIRRQLPDHFDVLQAADSERTSIPYIAPTNFDWDEMYYRNVPSGGSTLRWPMSQWQQELTDTDQNVNTATDPQGMPGTFDRQLFSKPYPYIQQEIYFTSGNTPFHAYVRDLSSGGSRDERGATQRTFHDLDRTQLRTLFDELNVRVPFNFIDLDRYRYSGGLQRELVSLAHRFVSTYPGGEEPNNAPDRADIRIAPVMPGRYAVIGSAGTIYRQMIREQNVPAGQVGRLRFINTIGRNVSGGQTPEAFTRDAEHVSQMETTRRIELRPSTNPLTQQFVVGANGGLFNDPPAPLDRYNELIALNNTTTENMTGEINGNELEAISRVVAPVVAVPIDDMSVSEPAYGYGVRARELSELEANSGDSVERMYPLGADREGAFVNSANTEVHFDTPMDNDPEFQNAADRPESFPKYRVVHLQRLADPTVPWNPPPPGYNYHDPLKRPFMAHDPALPVNPYLTVDSATVDLTVFNGTSSVNKANPRPQNKLYRSTERGYRANRSLGLPAVAVPQRNMWAQDFFMAPDRVLPSETTTLFSTNRAGMPQDMRAKHGVRNNHYDYMLRHSLGAMNEAFGAMYLQPEKAADANRMDAADPTDVDATAGLAGPAAGAPRPDAGLASTYPWLNWNNRPFVSESELLQVPAWSSSEMLRKFSTLNPNQQTDAYKNDAAIYSGPPITVDGDNIQTGDPIAIRQIQRAGVGPADLDADATNNARYQASTGSFGMLQNFFQSSRWSAAYFFDSNNDVIAMGSPNLHRLLDYVHTPSRFVATDTMLNPVAFNSAASSPTATPLTGPQDPRLGMLAPFNFVPDYREPGKVNLNTVAGQRLPGQLMGGNSGPSNPTSGSLPTIWSDVFDGVMHRVRDNDVTNTGPYGHFGPAWRDVTLSRRGYEDPLFGGGSPRGEDRADLVMNNSSPTFFGNPFRSSEAADLVPLSAMVQNGAEASMLRSHPFRPGAGLAWGNAGGDDNGNNLFDDAREAGINDGLPFDKTLNPASPQASVPLFSELCSTPAIDATRNSAMHTMPLTRLDNLTTTRSGVFAIWVTVGYFEVLPAPPVEDWFDSNIEPTEQKFLNQSGGDPTRAQALYNKVYSQGYQLGREVGSDIGDVERHRGFYIIDRTRPVAFKPGEDVNVEDAILLRRRID